MVLQIIRHCPFVKSLVGYTSAIYAQNSYAHQFHSCMSQYVEDLSLAKLKYNLYYLNTFKCCF